MTIINWGAQFDRWGEQCNAHQLGCHTNVCSDKLGKQLNGEEPIGGQVGIAKGESDQWCAMHCGHCRLYGVKSTRHNDNAIGRKWSRITEVDHDSEWSQMDRTSTGRNTFDLCVLRPCRCTHYSEPVRDVHYARQWITTCVQYYVLSAHFPLRPLKQVVISVEWISLVASK